jgi:hypothetical protein
VLDPDPEVHPPAAHPGMVWTSDVVEVTSAGVTHGSHELVGPPNAGSGASPYAWHAGPDASAQVEVRFAEPHRLAATHVVQNFNPGAVRAVVLIGASGKRTRRVVPPDHAKDIDLVIRERACTAEPIAAIRLELETGPVEAQLDAIGYEICAP